MKTNCPRKFVLTGGPGVGKTTLLEMLKFRNFQAIPEASTMLIKELLANGQQHPVHSGKLQEFQDMIWQKQLFLEAQIQPGMDVILDRSIIDGIAYCEIFNLVKHHELLNAAHNSNYSIIFMLDFLESFDVNHIRLETTDEALKIHQKIELKYLEFGYKLIYVPAFCVNEHGNKLSIEDSTQKRANFICEKIKNNNKKTLFNFKKSQDQPESIA